MPWIVSRVAPQSRQSQSQSPASPTQQYRLTKSLERQVGAINRALRAASIASSSPGAYALTVTVGRRPWLGETFS